MTYRATFWLLGDVHPYLITGRSQKKLDFPAEPQAFLQCSLATA
jgi:hypothetical protein